MSPHSPAGVPLFDEWEVPNYRVREKTRGRQGVYLLKKRGVVRYVGSSVMSEHAAPLRMWKTILRHFQKCAPAAAKRYGFGDDNFCTSRRSGWRIVLHLCGANVSADDVRRLEAAHVAAFKPADQAQKKPPAKPRKKRR